MTHFRLVLADPRFAANIGFTARVCANFGIEDFRGVSREPGRWHWDEANKIAVAPADRILDGFRILDTVPEAVADCDLVVGFTRRLGEDRRPELTPGSLVQVIRERQPRKVALLFGNEETGLTEEQLRPCTHLCMIPTSEAMPSMNLSHAVAVVLSRLFEDFCSRPVPAPAGDRPVVATSAELGGLFGHWREFMISAGITEAGNPERLLRRVERIFYRANLGTREVKILRGILAKSLLRMRREQR